MKQKDSLEAARIIGDMVFGANDGIVTTFAVVAGVAGASLEARIVLIMGLANLVGDGISMAVGDYLGRKSEIEVHEQIHVKNATNPVKNAIAMLCAFLLAGFVPLMPYVFGMKQGAFFISIVCAAAAMFTVGALRSVVVKRRWWSAGFEVLCVGSVAAISAFFVGYILKHVVS